MKKFIILFLVMMLFPLSMGYTNWDTGEPNDAGDGEDCAEANWNGDKWNDIDCTDNLHNGLCEMPDGSYETTSSMTWSNSRQECISRGGDLAVIDSQTENDNINLNYGNVWIGYYQPNTASEPSGGWSWVDEARISNPRPAQSTGSSPSTSIDTTLAADIGFSVTESIDVEFYEGSPGSNLLSRQTVSGGSTASMTWNNREAGNTYDWSIQACNSTGSCVTGGPYTFTVDTAEWKLDILGSSTATTGVSQTYFARVENVGTATDSPGLLKITKDGNVEESQSIGNLNPGEDREISESLTFSLPVDYQVCASADNVNGDDCMTVSASDASVAQDWRNMVSFRMDLTGPDSGLGWDMDKSWQGIDSSMDYAPTQIDSRDQDPDEGYDRVFFTDLYWQGTSSEVDNGNDITDSDLIRAHEAPMCGDDQNEYLLEELGQAEHPERSTGPFACADDNTYCHYRGVSGPKLFSVGDALQTNQPGEQYGRLKDNKAVCAQRVGLTSTSMDRDYDPVPQWYSQDYANNISYNSYSPPSNIARTELKDQNICRENNLYGRIGVRWINKDSLQSTPLAFNRGIDDSWNQRMEQMGHPYLISDPEGNNWNLGDNIIDNGYTPVPTGVSNLNSGYGSADPGETVVADPTSMDYGFCAGDDVSEYLIFQDSNSRLLDTDQSKIGVASSPDSCVLDNSELTDIRASDMESGSFSGDELQNERMLYQEGESVNFESGDTRRTVACFGGKWWSNFPISFVEDTASVRLGTTGFTTFRLINPDQNEKTFDLGINPRGSPDTVEDLNQMVTFEDTGTQDMTVTVPGQSSLTYRLKIQGNREIDTRPLSDSEDIEVFAETSDGSLDGQDQVDLLVNQTNVGTTSGSRRSIPGLTFIQLAVIAAISSLIFFRN